MLYLFHPMRDPFYVRQKAGNSVVPSSAVQDASSVIATSSAPIATSAAVRKEWEYPTLPQAGAVTGARLFYQEVHGAFTKKFSESRGLIPDWASREIGRVDVTARAQHGKEVGRPPALTFWTGLCWQRGSGYVGARRLSHTRPLESIYVYKCVLPTVFLCLCVFMRVYSNLSSKQNTCLYIYIYI